jgi:GNAT superfamily N-acetyltransferase
MAIELRTARAEDFEYCQRLYFEGMKKIIEDLHLDLSAQAANFERDWILAQVRIIVLDGGDAGWLQTRERDDGLFVAQLFVDGPFQRRGIGTEIMLRLINEAARVNQPILLAVVKINPAVRLYERLGFRITHEDERKFYMKREPAGGSSQ